MMQLVNMFSMFTSREISEDLQVQFDHPQPPKKYLGDCKLLDNGGDAKDP